MKHERDITAARGWRKSKTLSRNVNFRPIEDEDTKYAWAAYKKGCLVDMAGPFVKDDMTAEEFKVAFETTVLNRYHGAWTLFANTPKRGMMPIGFVFAFYSHSDHAMSPFMIVGDIVWLPWASSRNKVESAVNFFNKIRKEIPMMVYAHARDRRFMEVLAKHGVMQRVGTTFSVVRNVGVPIFETRNKGE